MKKAILLISLLTLIFNANAQNSTASNYYVLNSINSNDNAQNSLNSSDHNPLLVIILMVKDEAHVMRSTLEPYLKAGIDSYLILDTGSTDTTVETTQLLFEEYGAQHGYIVQKPFVDFATSRNHALEFAEQYFPNAAFFLMIDAEWYLHDVPGLIQFCKINYQIPMNSFLLRITDNIIDFSTQRLFKAQAKIRYTGVVHEVPNQVATLQLPDSIYFELQTTNQGRDKTQRRFSRDRDALLKEYAKNPHDSRTLFYLAQTYSCLGDNENALIFYKKRSEVKGYDEEDFMAHYRLAQVYEALDKWNMALCYYLKAYNMRPTRAEPLIKLALHYWFTQEFVLSFMFARQAVAIAYPTSDRLFVEKTAYDYTRYDALGCAAWYVNEFEIGLNAVLEALRSNPNAQHLHSNLVLYLQKTHRTA
jgi:tetratricopeptide (TPR) repeat protein